MLILLIRHGETVDNIAGLYAGVTDSKLTNQGVLQASRLAAHLWAQYGGLTHIFTSDLQRAARTGQAIADYQNDQRQSPSSKLGHPSTDKPWHPEASADTAAPTVIPFQLPVLREQDFGSLERQSWSSSKVASLSSSSPSNSNKAAASSGNAFVQPESKAAMDVRADEFINDYLLPLLASCHDEGEVGKTSEGSDSASSEVQPQLKVAVVSHGMLLSRLWKRLLSRCTSWSRDVSLTPEAQASVGPRGLEHLGGWSNTGYLVLDIDFVGSHATITPKRGKETMSNSKMPSSTQLVRNKGDQSLVASSLSEVQPVESKQDTDQRATATPTTVSTGQSPMPQPSSIVNLPSSSPAENDPTNADPQPLTLTIAVQAVNVTEHLKGLKRTRGGVGSAAHDDSQKSIHSFFKRRKVD